MIKPAYSVSFLLSINIFVWQNVLYFLDAPRKFKLTKKSRDHVCQNTTRMCKLPVSTIFGVQHYMSPRKWLKMELRVHCIYNSQSLKYTTLISQNNCQNFRNFKCAKQSFLRQFQGTFWEICIYCMHCCVNFI